MVLAGIVPLVAYLLTASGYTHWLDSGEFVAIAADLGISHPPGHPLAALTMSLIDWVPFGSMAFRLSVLNALLGALASVVLFRAFWLSLWLVQLRDENVVAGLALACTWWLAGTYAWWFQAVRPEVYALQGLLLAIVVERFLTLEATWESGNLAPLYQAALVFGVALCNHHYLAALILIAGIPFALRVVRERGIRPIAISAGLSFSGLVAYIYLPIRAATNPYLNLGEPTTLQRFWWVFTAKAFQKNVAPEDIQPLWQRLMDVAIVLVEQLGGVVVIVAVFSTYLLLRLSRTRRLAVFWVLMLLAYALGRAAIGFISGNPDAIGYLMPCFVATIALAIKPVGLALSAWATSEKRRRLAGYIAAAFAVFSLWQFPRMAESSSLRGFADTDGFDDGLRRDVPERAVIFVHNPQTMFRYWGGAAEELLRPDVTMVPLPFLTYPGLVERLIAQDPALKPILRNHLLNDELNENDLQNLAARRPVLVEMDVRVPPALYRTMVPDGLYHRVMPDGATDEQERQGARHHAAAWEDLYAQLRFPLDPDTKKQLMWRHFLDALYYAGYGDRERARWALDAALQIAPQANELVALKNALEQGSGPIDVTRFFPK